MVLHVRFRIVVHFLPAFYVFWVTGTARANSSYRPLELILYLHFWPLSSETDRAIEYIQTVGTKNEQITLINNPTPLSYRLYVNPIVSQLNSNDVAVHGLLDPDSFRFLKAFLFLIQCFTKYKSK